MIALPLHSFRPASMTGTSVLSSMMRLGQHRVVALDDLLHVADAIAADVIDAHIEDVNAFAFLLAGHLDEAVPVFLFEQLLELPRAVGVGSLADEQRARI